MTTETTATLGIATENASTEAEISAAAAASEAAATAAAYANVVRFLLANGSILINQNVKEKQF